MSSKIISLQISQGSFSYFVEKIFHLSRTKQSSYVCLANVHMTIEAYWDPEFAKIVNAANLITPDGMPIVKALKFLYGIRQDRVAGMDLMTSLLKEAEVHNLSVFFYGGTEEMLLKTQEYINIKFPKIINHHYYSPPFRSLSDEENEYIITKINETGAHLVLVVLGCPKQEKWMAAMKGKVQGCMIGVGGALPVMIGLKRRAPNWMRSRSLEWFFRLLQEPKRLIKRYLITNSLFIYLFTKQLIRLKFKTPR